MYYEYNIKSLIGVFFSQNYVGSDWYTVHEPVLRVVFDKDRGHFFYETENGIGKGYWGCGHQACIRDFYRCLEEGRRFQADVKGVENTFETVMRIYEKGEDIWNKE